MDFIGGWFALATEAGADEISDLKQQLAEQQKMLEQMQQKLAEFEAKQAAQEQKIEEQVVKVVEEKKETMVPDSLKWAEKVKISGDLRYRYEWIDEEGNDERNRNRIRARLGLTGQVTDDIEVGMRLATSEEISSGNGDPVSTNQTLDDAFSKKSFCLFQVEPERRWPQCNRRQDGNAVLSGWRRPAYLRQRPDAGRYGGAVHRAVRRE